MSTMNPENVTGLGMENNLRKYQSRLRFGPPPTNPRVAFIELNTGISSEKPGFLGRSKFNEFFVAGTRDLTRDSIKPQLQRKVLPPLPSQPAAREMRKDLHTPTFNANINTRPNTPSILPIPEEHHEPTKSAWHIYNEKASKEDNALQRNINESMDVVLIFAGLFSATSTAFLQFTLPLLQKGSMEDTNQLLVSIFQKLGDSSYTMPQQRSFIANATAISINCLIFASIAGSLIAAFFALSVKQWTRSYATGLENIVTPQLLARHRHFRIEGVRQWHLVDISRMLPMILHIALSLFAVGVAEFLLYTSGIKLAIIVIVAGATTALIHISLSLTPLVYPQSPFRSPLTSLLDYLFILIGRYSRKLQKGSRLDNDYMNPLDQALGKEAAVSRLIHTSKHLDIGVLINLMELIDRHTEDWVLDLCLAELTKLRHIPPDRYHLFYHDTVFDSYLHMAATCVSESEGQYTIVSGMESRAKTVCNFLTWFDSVTYIQTLDPRSHKLASVGSSKDTRRLTDAYYYRGLRSKSLHDIVDGYLAFVASMHLLDTDRMRKCSYCMEDTEDRSGAVLEFLLAYDINLRDDGRSLEERKKVIAYIGFQIRCTFQFKGIFMPSMKMVQSFKALIQKYELGSPILSEEWKVRGPSKPPCGNHPSNFSWMDILPATYYAQRTAWEAPVSMVQSHFSIDAPQQSLPFRYSPLPTYPTMSHNPYGMSMHHQYPPPKSPPPSRWPPHQDLFERRSIPAHISDGQISAGYSEHFLLPHEDETELGDPMVPIPPVTLSGGTHMLRPLPLSEELRGGELERRELERQELERHREQQTRLPTSPKLSHEVEITGHNTMDTKAQVYCDVYIVSTVVQHTTIRIEPAESMVLMGSSSRGDRIDNWIKFSVTTEPRVKIEPVLNDSLASSLFYSLGCNSNYENYDYFAINPDNAFVISQNAFQGHLSAQMYRLGLDLQIVVNFMETHMESLEDYDFVAYRFLSQKESAEITGLSVGLPDCIFHSVYVLVRGLSGGEIDGEEWRNVEEAADIDWVTIVGQQNGMRGTNHNSILELAMIHTTKF